MGFDSLIGALLGSRGMVAGLLSVGEGAVVLSIIVSRQGVVRVIPGVPKIRALLGLLAERFLDWQGWEEFRILLDLGLGHGSLQNGPTCILSSPNGSNRVRFTVRGCRCDGGILTCWGPVHSMGE